MSRDGVTHQLLEIQKYHFTVTKNDRLNDLIIFVHGPDGMTVFPPRGKPSIVDFVISKKVSGISEVKVLDNLSFEIQSNIITSSSFSIKLEYKRSFNTDDNCSHNILNKLIKQKLTEITSNQ